MKIKKQKIKAVASINNNGDIINIYNSNKCLYDSNGFTITYFPSDIRKVNVEITIMAEPEWVVKLKNIKSDFKEKHKLTREKASPLSYKMVKK